MLGHLVEKGYDRLQEGLLLREKENVECQRKAM